ncbi:hypothetical protein [Moritella sp. F3]|uniref:hypothetical protein n=1 Tax=Moritella sp. F3 TaxID=2718882 RepID=UPI0018E11992|nr:hypothetical protein [Moritella sp. F3]GIC77083.1 hypothetical protein FMO001_18100 [Moritella sp. F1]GIC82202.1 hypothetical protein FMO003_24830 [Moritella sp. F3]
MSKTVKTKKGALKLRLGTLDQNYTITSEEFVDVDDLADAKRKWMAFTDEQEFGRYTLGGDVFDSNDEVIGIFSPNGRLCEPSDKGDEYYKRLSSGVEIVDFKFT